MILVFAKTRLLVIFMLSMLLCQQAYAWDYFGEAGVDVRYFTQSPQFDQQFEDISLSAYFEPQFYKEWDAGKQSVAFVPFVRVDQHDSERSHVDVRELTYVRSAQDWELRLGVRKVFWGVIEFQHLVDVINQTDAVENIDGEDKLGQAMVNLALINDWGTVDFYVMPYFRERTFADRDGRFRSAIPIDGDAARYESDAEQTHIDLAVRYQHSFNNIDLGLAHFRGTNRDPHIIAETDSSGITSLIPFYDIIDQTSLDVQMTTENVLWKLEALHRSDSIDSYNAVAAGMEYTFYNVFTTFYDLGVLAEYHYDDRDELSTTGLEHDIAIGARLSLNDVQSTEALAGLLIDKDSRSKFFSLEASRRLQDSWVIDVQARFLLDQPEEDPFFAFTRDDYFDISLSYHF